MYLYQFAHLPCKRVLSRQLEDSARGLVDELRGVNISSLDMSSYNKTYLKSYQQNLVSVMQKNTYIIANAIGSLGVDLSDVTLIDYGGGPGVVSLLAKRLGVGTVIYNDIKAESCHAAEALANAIDCHVDHYVEGDLDDLLSYQSQHALAANAIVSSNVIEHIYDIEEFFTRLPAVSDGTLSIVMSTRANEANRSIRTRYRKRHQRFERKGPNGATIGYLQQRREMIENWAPQLSASEQEELAARTRGKMTYDIQNAVTQYVETQELPAPLEHPTNTCCPETGNWAEHLMDPFSITAPLKEQGFNTRVLSGYYSTSTWTKPADWARTIANVGVRCFRTAALSIAPFYTILAIRKASH